MEDRFSGSSASAWCLIFAVMTLVAVSIGTPDALRAEQGPPSGSEARIQPANRNASEDARKLLTYLYQLPSQSENRLISGHLAGGSIGPSIPKERVSGYRFKMDEIEYLHEVSGNWVGLIGADYCAGWIKSDDPLEATMYYKDLNRGLIDYWNAGGLVMITLHQFDPRQLHKGGGYHKFLDWRVDDPGDRKE